MFSGNKVSFLRYVINGIFMNTLGFSLYILLTYFAVGPKLGMSISYCFFLCISFYWHKRYSFMGIKSPSPKLVFLCVHLSAYAINISMLYLLVDIYKFNHKISQGVLVIFIAAYLYYMLRKYVFSIVNRE